MDRKLASLSIYSYRKATKKVNMLTAIAILPHLTIQTGIMVQTGF